MSKKLIGDCSLLINLAQTWERKFPLVEDVLGQGSGADVYACVINSEVFGVALKFEARAPRKAHFDELVLLSSDIFSFNHLLVAEDQEELLELLEVLGS